MFDGNVKSIFPRSKTTKLGNYFKLYLAMNFVTYYLLYFNLIYFNKFQVLKE